MQKMNCEICGHDGAELRHVRRRYGKGESLREIENVPVISCPNCGESYLTAVTIQTLDKIHQRKRLKPVQDLDRLPPEPADFKEFLASAPLEGIDLTRDRSPGRPIDL